MHDKIIVIIKKIIRSVLWVAPFVAFCFGYFFSHLFFHKKVIPAPNIIGKSIHEAVKVATATGLNIRLLREKVDADVIEGVVLEQTPQPRRFIRPNQSLFVTLSKQPPAILAPEVVTLKQEQIAQEVKKLGIRSKTFWVESIYPKNVCLAQTPRPGMALKKLPLVTYLSSGRSNLFVFPKLIGRPLGEVKEFLEGEGLKMEIFYEKRAERGEACYVLDQKPMAGTIIDRKLYVQLQVGMRPQG